MSEKIPVDIELVDAAVELTAFCQVTPYPKENSMEFMRLTTLVNNLDVQVRKFVKEGYAKKS